MLKRDWDGQFGPYIIVAVGLALIAFLSWSLAFSKGYQSANEHYAAENAADQASEQQYRDCVAQPTTKMAVDCYRKADKAYREETRAEQDLNAQREMADWAESMLWATWSIGLLSMGVGVVGIIFVNKTLSANREANAFMLAEQRPWVTLERNVPCVFSADDIGASCHWTYNISNRGKLPAKRAYLGQKIVRYSDLFHLRPVFNDFVTESRQKANDRLGRIFPATSLRQRIGLNAIPNCRHPANLTPCLLF